MDHRHKSDSCWRGSGAGRQRRQTYRRATERCYDALLLQSQQCGVQADNRDVSAHARIEDQAMFLADRGIGGSIGLGGGACDILFGTEQTDEYIVTRSMVTFCNRSVAVDIQTDIIFDNHNSAGR